MLTDMDWDPIQQGGSNGFALVVMASSQWVDATKAGDGSNNELHTAIGDVTWVLSKLIAPLNVEIGNKHPYEAITENEPK